MIDEGYIKFNCRWSRTESLPSERFAPLNLWRQKLHQAGFIGVYPDGIGFGNISLRDEGTRFLITGTQTGHLPVLTGKHYTLVTAVDIPKNEVVCEGPIQASSESMTHAVIYALNKEIRAVMHIHHPELWNKLKDKIPTTRADVPYGTPEMADEIRRLYRESDLQNQKILVMAGHEEGIIAFGKTLQEAGDILFRAFEAV